MAERFDELRRMGIRTVMITGDNPLTAKAIADEAGVDDYLAEAKPEDKMALIKREQQGGKLVAMTGDGTNDAPALAQADVGVAMNTGTSAAKEAGNMVDLDSDPTKLIEIVEIGKQLLITRGALTTFSIANDVAKYFAIIPAMFAAVYPGLDKLNIMRLHSPESAILSAVIFNALIIVALIPLALRGVRYRPSSASAMLRRNIWRGVSAQGDAHRARARSRPPGERRSSTRCRTPRRPKDSAEAAGKTSLLTQVCSRSLAIGQLEGVSGARPFCTPDGVGAVLGVFYAEPSYRGPVTRVVSLNQACPATPFLESYRGVRVECATPNTDYSAGQVVPIRGDAPAKPAVPSDAVTASGSGLDPPSVRPTPACRRNASRRRGHQCPEVAALVTSIRPDAHWGSWANPR